MPKRRYKRIRYRRDNSDRIRLYIIGGIALAILIAGIILLAIFIAGRDKDSAENKNDDRQPKLQTNAVLPVNQLVERYYEAKKSCDAAALMALIYPGMVIDEGELKVEAELVEDYLNIICYTLPGLDEDSYVVWVEFEYKFRGIEKAAPALNRLYVVKSTETDEYQIYATPDDEIVNHIEKLSKRDDVKELSEKIEKRLNKAIEADEQLKDFYNQLSAGAEK